MVPSKFWLTLSKVHQWEDTEKVTLIIFVVSTVGKNAPNSKLPPKNEGAVLINFNSETLRDVSKLAADGRPLLSV